MGPPQSTLDVLAEAPEEGEHAGVPAPAFFQPELADSKTPDGLQETAADLGAVALDDSAPDDRSGSSNIIVESEPNGYGGMRHLWNDGVWRPDGTVPHRAENVTVTNGIQYPIYLTVNPADGKYYPLKEDADDVKEAQFGSIESVGVVFAFPPLGWQRINIGRQLYERCCFFFF